MSSAPMTVPANGVVGLLLRNCDSTDPTVSNKVALVDGPTGRSFSYGTMGQLIRSCGVGLVNELGVNVGDVIGIVAPNIPDVAIVSFAAIAIGAVPALISPHLRLNHLTSQLTDCGCGYESFKCVITLPALVTIVSSAVQQCMESEDAEVEGVPIVVFGGADGAIPFGALLQEGSAARISAPLVPVEGQQQQQQQLCEAEAAMEEITVDAERDVAIILYDAVGEEAECHPLTHLEVIAGLSPPSQQQHMVNNHTEKGVMKTQRMLLGLLPFYESDGFIGILLAGSIAGTTIVTLDSFSPCRVCDLLLRYSLDDVHLRALWAQQMASYLGKQSNRSVSVRSLCRRKLYVVGRLEDNEESANKQKNAAITATLTRIRNSLVQHKILGMSCLDDISCPRSLTSAADSTNTFLPPILDDDAGSHSTSDAKRSANARKMLLPFSFNSNSNHATPVYVSAKIRIKPSSSSDAFVHADQFTHALLCVPGVDKVQAQANGKDKGCTLLVAGEWDAVFRGLRRCQMLGNMARGKGSFNTGISMDISTQTFDNAEDGVEAMSQNIPSRQENAPALPKASHGSSGVDVEELLNRGITLFTDWKLTEAKVAFENVLKVAAQNNDRAVQARALGNLGSVEEAMSQSTAAISHYMECLLILKELGDTQKQVRILQNMSQSYLALKQPRKAKKYLVSAMEVCEDEQVTTNLRQNLAQIEDVIKTL